MGVAVSQSGEVGSAFAWARGGETPSRSARWVVPPVEDVDTSAGRLGAVADACDAQDLHDGSGFYPRKPTTLGETGLSRDFLEKLIIRHFHVHGVASGRHLAREIGLSFRLIDPILGELKTEMLLVHKRTAAAGDYDYALSEAGNEVAERYMAACAYAEAAPVPFEDYVASVAAQSLTLQNIRRKQLVEAFADMLVEPSMLKRLGPAVNAGRGMFLYGSPGNGKTSIAERVVRCFGRDIWIPRTIMIDGSCVRLFDPVLHDAVASHDPVVLGEPLEDARWVRIHRPTVVVGGELTMDQLEMRHDLHTKVSEAPLQMKSNCGVLLIDDFGRQCMPIAQLLNRWIVPLEKRYDFQKLPSGKKIQVPFDQLVVFSTNLQPHDLVDEAFLRRLPYKIEVVDPTADQFRRILDLVAPSLGLELPREEVERLIEKYYLATGRPMRCCHPRDLLLQVRSFCLYNELPIELTDESVEFAVENYFGVM